MGFNKDLEKVKESLKGFMRCTPHMEYTSGMMKTATGSRIVEAHHMEYTLGTYAVSTNIYSTLFMYGIIITVVLCSKGGSRQIIEGTHMPVEHTSYGIHLRNDEDQQLESLAH